MRKGRGKNRKAQEGEKRGRNCIRERRKRRLWEDGVRRNEEWKKVKEETEKEKKKSVWERERMREKNESEKEMR